jgi:hypothetical protein
VTRSVLALAAAGAVIAVAGAACAGRPAATSPAPASPVAAPGPEYLGPASDGSGACAGSFALAIEGGESDANLNGVLVRYALDGSGRTVLLEGVTDVYPQAGGAIVAKRRTSRSGHVALFTAPGDKARAAVFAAAFDFADAAVEPGGRRVALVAKRDATPSWELLIAGLAAGTAASDAPRRVALPEGLTPEAVRWRRDGDPDDVSDGKGHPIVVAGRGADDKPVRFGLDGVDGAAPRWDGLPAYVESEAHDFILSKSHSLGAEQIEQDGRPAVRVAYYWWHGAVEDIAVLDGMTMDGYRWACRREALFVTGREGDGYTARTVVLRGGKVLTAVRGASRPVKLLF